MSDQHGSRPPAAWPTRASLLRSHVLARASVLRSHVLARASTLRSHARGRASTSWPLAGLLCSVVLGPIAHAQVHVISPEPDTTEPCRCRSGMRKRSQATRIPSPGLMRMREPRLSLHWTGTMAIV